MNKTILFLCFLLTAPAFASLKTLMPQESIKASDINANFNEVKSILDEKDTPILFNEFQSGSVINKESLETEFDKVRSLGITVAPLQSEKILAEELNEAFLQLLSGAQTYDDFPLSQDGFLFLNEDEVKPITFNYTNVIGTTVVQIVNPPTHGILIPNGASFNYQPGANYSGSDSFTYQIFDGSNHSSISTISITVAPLNDIPVASAQSVSTNEDIAKSISLNGTDVENSSLTYEVTSNPTLGTLSGTAPNLIYTPNSNEFGLDSFSFRVNDGTEWSTPAIVSINVNSINDIPTIAGNQTLTVDDSTTFVNSSALGADQENSPLTYTVAVAPAKGIITWGANGSYTYTASLNAFGADTFSLRVNDGMDNSSNLTVSVNITLQKSCKDLLALRPALLNIDNTYFIDLDGTGPIAAGQVLCDMTTAGGGWTNLAANIGAYSNVLKAKIVNNQSGAATDQALSTMGINSSSTSNAAVGGSLVSRAGPGTCVGSIPKLYVSAQTMNLIKPTQAKMIAKSYGTGTYDCGGILRHSDLSAGFPPGVKLSPINFASTTVARCDGAATYPASSTNVDITFYSPFLSADYTKDHAVAALEAICGAGTGYVQVKQLWVR